MYFKETLRYIVLMVAFFPTFGLNAHWGGRYSDESYREGSTRFRPFLNHPLPNHPNTSVWIFDSEQYFDSGLAWVLYNASPNIGKWKPEQDLLDLYFLPRWRQVETIIVENHEDFYDTFPQKGIAQNPLSGANDVEWLLNVEWLLKNWRTAEGKRVLRGGCYLTSPDALRVAWRINAWGKRSNHGFGFRCVRSVTP